MITNSTIKEAVKRLKEAASPAKIILFGSYARGEAHEDSDLDFLVIEYSVADPRYEMVRLRDVLRPMRLPVDIIVTSVDKIRDWGSLPGTILYEAIEEGIVLYEAS
ncbi:MAG: nucleotidyltransferase domain-containing protein [Methanosarcinaceae archaeon]|nr:nucleotidyltransferase domain-containing protein [Methanosarcinaceae archaeon]